MSVDYFNDKINSMRVDIVAILNNREGTPTCHTKNIHFEGFDDETQRYIFTHDCSYFKQKFVIMYPGVTDRTRQNVIFITATKFLRRLFKKC